MRPEKNPLVEVRRTRSGLGHYIYSQEIIACFNDQNLQEGEQVYVHVPMEGNFRVI